MDLDPRRAWPYPQDKRPKVLPEAPAARETLPLPERGDEAAYRLLEAIRAEEEAKERLKQLQLGQSMEKERLWNDNIMAGAVGGLYFLALWIFLPELLAVYAYIWILVLVLPAVFGFALLPLLGLVLPGDWTWKEALRFVVGVWLVAGFLLASFFLGQ